MPSLPTTRAKIGPDFSWDASNHAATNRIVSGDKYAVAPSPTVSVFERRMSMLPDPSPISSMSSILRFTNSSRRHIVSYATATSARSRMFRKPRGSTPKKISISFHTALGVAVRTHYDSFP